MKTLWSMSLPKDAEKARYISFEVGLDGRIHVIRNDGVLVCDESVPGELGFLAEVGASYDVVHIPESRSLR